MLKSKIRKRILNTRKKRNNKNIKFSFQKIFSEIKTKISKDTFKIYGNPSLKLSKTYEIKNFDKDHRACMLAFITALAFGGKWIIHDIDSVKTSFPNFISLLKYLGAKIN